MKIISYMCIHNTTLGFFFQICLNLICKRIQPLYILSHSRLREVTILSLKSDRRSVVTVLNYDIWAQLYHAKCFKAFHNKYGTVEVTEWLRRPTYSIPFSNACILHEVCDLMHVSYLYKPWNY